jgi:SRSO17 transposase
VRYRLYLTQEWAADAGRRRKAHVPEEIVFQTKPEIALDQLRWACKAGLPRGVVLLDAGYGNHTNLRAEIGALGLSYAAGILSSTTVWAPGTEPLPPKRWSGRGRRPTRMRHGKHKPVSVKELAFGLPKRAWRTIGWREGTCERLTSRFARVRVRAARGGELRKEEWLLIEWPKDEKEPTKYWLSTLPHDITFERLVDLAKLRWRIERDYQELKQELGLGHFEGRGWRGFHHHATLCIAAYGFLISEKETIPPSAPRPAARLPQLELPVDYQPRGAADPNRTPHPKLHRYHAAATDTRSRQKRAAMPLLRAQKRSPKGVGFMLRRNSVQNGAPSEGALSTPSTSRLA